MSQDGRGFTGPPLLEARTKEQKKFEESEYHHQGGRQNLCRGKTNVVTPDKSDGMMGRIRAMQMDGWLWTRYCVIPFFKEEGVR